MSETPRRYYNFESIRQIPILSVCERLGVDTKKKGGQYWCKLRPEKTASVLLHPEPERNTFKDFGDGTYGDVIRLTATVLGMEYADAAFRLAEMYGIEPEKRKGMTDWDYACIGLYGDLASKNLSFDFNNQTLDEMRKQSEALAIPMNELRKKDLNAYTDMLFQKAIPHVVKLRGQYYGAVCLEYVCQEAAERQGSVFSKSLETWFAENFDRSYIEDLQAAERALKRACEGTKIKAHEVGTYEPLKDIQKLLSGEVTPWISATSYNELNEAAKQQNTKLRYQSVRLDGYFGAGFDVEALDAFVHSVRVKNGTIVIGFLEKDKDKILPLLEPIRLREQQFRRPAQHQKKQSSNNVGKQNPMKSGVSYGKER